MRWACVHVCGGEVQQMDGARIEKTHAKNVGREPLDQGGSLRHRQRNLCRVNARFFAAERIASDADGEAALCRVVRADEPIPAMPMSVIATKRPPVER